MTMDVSVEPVEQVQIVETKKRGFTLTEIAIVLGIIGLILGAIWVAAAAVYNNLRVSKGTTELLQIAQSVRALYATSATMVDAAGKDESPALCLAGVFPADTIVGGVCAAASPVANGPWTGSTIMVTSQALAGGTNGDSFGVEFNTVPTQACVSMLTANTGSGRDPGLIYAGASAATLGAAAWTAANTLAIPTSPTVAAGVCKTSGTNYFVQFGFKLKG